MWTGSVIVDFGSVSNRQISRAHRSLSVVLSEKQGRRLFLREAYRRFGAFSVRFIELDRDEVLRLDAIFQEALDQM